MNTIANFEPLYLKVRRMLLEQITADNWEPNKRLPNEFELARTFNVSQGTVRKALTSLTQEGLLTRAQGKGTYVSDLSLEQAMHIFYRVEMNDKAVADEGNRPYAHLHDYRIVGPNEHLLNMYPIDKNEQFMMSERFRVISDTPVVFEKIYLPLSIFKNIEDTPEDLKSRNLYRKYQKSHGVFINKVTEKIFPEKASPELKMLLPRSELLLRVERVATNQSGIPVEYRTYWVDAQHSHYYANLNRH